MGGPHEPRAFQAAKQRCKNVNEKSRAMRRRGWGSRAEAGIHAAGTRLVVRHPAPDHRVQQLGTPGFLLCPPECTPDKNQEPVHPRGTDPRGVQQGCSKGAAPMPGHPHQMAFAALHDLGYRMPIDQLCSTILISCTGCASVMLQILQKDKRSSSEPGARQGPLAACGLMSGQACACWDVITPAYPPLQDSPDTRQTGACQQL